MGINQGPISLDQKYTQGSGHVFMTGIQALVRLPMAQIRRDKVCVTAAEVDAEACGWAAPIHQGELLLGSLSVVMWSQAPNINPQRVADHVLRAALRIGGRLETPR